MIPADVAARASLQTGRKSCCYQCRGRKKQKAGEDSKPKKHSTKFAEYLLLFVTGGEEDFGVEALCLEALPGGALGPGFVPGVHLDVQIDLEQVRVLLLNVAGVQIIPEGRGEKELREGRVTSSGRQRLNDAPTLQT